MGCKSWTGRPRRVATALVLGTLWLASANARAAEFIDLGDLAGGADDSEARAVSADGSVVVGVSTTGAGPTAFRWTRSTGLTALPHWYVSPSGIAHSEAEGISADGSTIVGWTEIPDLSTGGTRTLAARWSDGGSIKVYSSSYGQKYATVVSADGSAVLGHSGADNVSTFATRYTDTGTSAFGLPPDSGYRYTRVTGVTGDGATALVRTQKTSTSAWVSYLYTFSGHGYQFLGGMEVGDYHDAKGVASDGSFVVGAHKANPGAGSVTAFRWTPTGGFQDLGAVPGHVTATARAVSDDGGMVVGRSEPTAFIWTPVGGMQDLQAIAEDTYGLDLCGFTLTEAQDVSADGTVIVGYGTTAGGKRHAFWLSLSDNDRQGDLAPLGSPDGVVNVADYLIAMRIAVGDLEATGLELSRGDLYPPCAPDGVIDLRDVLVMHQQVF